MGGGGGRGGAHGRLRISSFILMDEIIIRS